MALAAYDRRLLDFRASRKPEDFAMCIWRSGDMIIDFLSLVVSGALYRRCRARRPKGRFRGWVGATFNRSMALGQVVRAMLVCASRTQ